MRTKAFTMVELAVTLVIIGILAAIGAYAYTSFLSNSKQGAAKEDYSAVADAIAAYSATTGIVPSPSTSLKLEAPAYWADISNRVGEGDVVLTLEPTDSQKLLVNFTNGTMTCTGLYFYLDESGNPPSGTASCV